MALAAHWNYPTDIRVGDGCIEQIGARCLELKMTRVLLITDPLLAKLPMVEQILTLCTDAGLHADMFYDIQGNPTGENVHDGAKMLNCGGFDGVIALGGGSGLDVAKAVAMIAKQSIDLWDTEDVGDNWTKANSERIAPIIAVPTTAGTGSETGRASVILNQETGVKNIFFIQSFYLQL